MVWLASGYNTHLVWHFDIARLSCPLILSLSPHKTFRCLLSCPSSPYCVGPFRIVERSSQRSKSSTIYTETITGANSLSLTTCRYIYVYITRSQVLLTGKQCPQAVDTKMSVSGDVLLLFSCFHLLLTHVCVFSALLQAPNV